MPHTRLKARLQAQINRLQDTAGPDRAIIVLRSRIAERIPARTGTMAANVLKVSGPRVSPGSIEYGLGDLDRIGNPNRAPRGTIAKFLQDFPRYRNVGRIIESRFAWWLLSAEAKERLQLERQAGKYGGGYLGVGLGKSAYFYAQEGTDPAWAESASAAGIEPQHFVRDAFEIWKESDLPKLVEDYIRSVLA